MTTNDVLVVTMNEKTHGDTELNDPKKFRYPLFDRSTHAKFLNHLRTDGARLVVFDLFFRDPTDEDSALAQGITRHGNVILGADLEVIGPNRFAGVTLKEPALALRNLPGSRLGLLEVYWDEDKVVREFPRTRTNLASLPMAAVEGLGKQVKADPPNHPRYIHFYGDEGTLPSEEYQDAFRKGPGFFKDKIVFIGGKPKITTLGETTDFYWTPFSRWSKRRMAGVELQATMFLNLLNNEWLNRMSQRAEIIVVLLASGIFGLVFGRTRPVPGLLWALGMVFLTWVLAIYLFWSKRIWFDWVLIGGVQVPVAWASAALVYSTRLHREKQRIEKELETFRSRELTLGPAAPPALPVAALAGIEPGPQKKDGLEIRDFELLRCIGEGAYGEVWLARSLTGAYRAIKIIHRNRFSEQRPFEREFEGVRTFVPISLTNPGWVAVLHVGKDDSRGFFYYVMEAADDMASGSKIDPNHYTPKTLGKMLVEKPWLPVVDCVGIGIQLADALAALHKLGLVHRDVKPSNVIFAKDHTKLADIGLVATAEGPKSFAGTEGFIPPEGPGTPLADIFSLGRTLYQAATGCDPKRQPGLPTALGERTDQREFMRLMDIINIACASLPGRRYASAEDLRKDLAKLEKSLNGRGKGI